MKLFSLVVVTFLSMNGVYAPVRLYGNEANNWHDPIKPVSLTLTANATNPLRIGDVVEYRCTAHNLPMVTNTLEWEQIVAGTSKYRIIAGRSPLILVKTVDAKDHNTELVCGVSYTEYPKDRESVIYYAKSDHITMQVEGVISTNTPPTENGERIMLTVQPIKDSYYEYDTMHYVCNTMNIRYAFIEIIQAKGNQEVILYTGYHTAYRWIHHNLTKADDGSRFFCQARLQDWRRNIYALPSEPYHVHVK